MPRDSTGQYSRQNGSFSGRDTWNDQANSPDKVINSGRHDTHDNDLGDALTDSLSRSGKGGMQSNLDLGGNSLLNGDISTAILTPTDRTTARQVAIQAALAQGVYDITDPEWGAVADSTTDVGPAIQAAIDEAAANGGGIVWVPAAPSGQYYRITKPLYARDRVIVMGAGAQSLIRNDRATQTQFPDQACWQWGQQSLGADQNKLTAYDIADVSGPANVITTATAAEAGNFAVDDLIVVRSGAHYLNSSSEEVFHYYLFTRVLAVDSGTGNITLEKAVNTDLATTGGRKPSVINPNESGVTGRFGDQIFASYRAGLCNIAFQTENMWTNDGGGLECFMDSVWIEGNGSGSCIGGNRMSVCSFNNIWANVWRKFTEVKLGSHDNILTNIFVTFKENASFAVQDFIDFGESARDNMLNGFNVDMSVLNSAIPPIAFFDSLNNRVKNGTLYALAQTSRFVTFQNTTEETPNDAPCAGNVMEHVKLFGGTLQQYWAFDVGAGLVCNDNALLDCEFTGTLTAQAGILDGLRNRVERTRGSDSDPGVLFASTSQDCKLVNNENLGNLTQSSRGLNGDLAANVVYGNSGPESQLCRGAYLLTLPGQDNINSTTPNNPITNGSTTFPATSLRNEDQIEYEITGIVSGTAGIKTIQVTDDSGAIATCEVAASDTGSFYIKGLINIVGSGQYVSQADIFDAAAASSEDVRRTGLDLTNNDRVFTSEAWVANAADTITIRTVRFEPVKRGFAVRII